MKKLAIIVVILLGGIHIEELHAQVYDLSYDSIPLPELLEEITKQSGNRLFFSIGNDEIDTIVVRNFHIRKTNSDHVVFTEIGDKCGVKFDRTADKERIIVKLKDKYLACLL